MKGILLNCLGKKEEARDFVKRGLRSNIQSFVCKPSYLIKLNLRLAHLWPYSEGRQKVRRGHPVLYPRTKIRQEQPPSTSRPLCASNAHTRS